MIAKSDAASIFRDTRGSRSIEISVPGAFTAVGFSGKQKNPGASAAERGRPSLFKTIDEDRRERHDYINRSGRSTYPGRNSVLTSGATPVLGSHDTTLHAVSILLCDCRIAGCMRARERKCAQPDCDICQIMKQRQALMSTLRDPFADLSTLLTLLATAPGSGSPSEMTGMMRLHTNDERTQP